MNNYKQALDVLKGESTLKPTMANLNISGARVFMEWLEEERVYLKGLPAEPICEMQNRALYSPPPIPVGFL
jgi:hypothetical protein